jgi:uncharacterized membrane-anchored protein
MTLLPPDHLDRMVLAEELHARPPETLETPSRVSYVALLVDPAARDHERQHLATLCESSNVVPPPPEARHFSANLGSVRLKWERHGEFSGYTFITAGRSPQPFSEPPIVELVPGWLAAIPGSTIFAAHVKIDWVGDTEADPSFLVAHFDDHVIVGSEIGGGAGLAYTDFRVRADGFQRFLVLNRAFTPRQTGRMAQRLLEIEAYRMMALLALPLVPRLSLLIGESEKALVALTEELKSPGANDELLLQRLTQLATEVQGAVTRTQFRFDACRAYHDLVTTRIQELRERRLPGIQPIEQFMARRFTPAVATCAATAQRLRDLSDRVGQASALLSTRVDIVREQQNQRLLEAMNVRAERQFQLQQAVEGLSVAAIVYYGTGLVGYLARALKDAGVHVDPDIADGLAIPIIAIVCVFAIWRAHKRLDRMQSDRAHQAQR